MGNNALQNDNNVSFNYENNFQIDYFYSNYTMPCLFYLWTDM